MRGKCEDHGSISAFYRVKARKYDNTIHPERWIRDTGIYVFFSLFRGECREVWSDDEPRGCIDEIPVIDIFRVIHVELCDFGERVSLFLGEKYKRNDPRKTLFMVWTFQQYFYLRECQILAEFLYNRSNLWYCQSKKDISFAIFSCASLEESRKDFSLFGMRLLTEKGLDREEIHRRLFIFSDPLLKYRSILKCKLRVLLESMHRNPDRSRTTRSTLEKLTEREKVFF